MVYGVLREIWLEAKSQTGLRSSLPRHPLGSRKRLRVLHAQEQAGLGRGPLEYLVFVNKTH